MHIQAPDNTIVELIATGAAENSSWGDSYQVGNPDVRAISGTKISSVVLNTTQGGQEIHVLFQEEADAGRGVTDFVRTLVGGTWAQLTVPVGSD